MNWCCKSYSICRECGVHFEPITGAGGDLCHPHRLQHLERERRITRVMDWAREHWESLEGQALESEKKNEAAYQDYVQDYVQRLAAHTRAAHNAPNPLNPVNIDLGGNPFNIDLGGNP